MEGYRGFVKGIIVDHSGIRVRCGSGDVGLLHRYGGRYSRFDWRLAMSKRLEHVEGARDESHKFGASFDYEVRCKNIVGVICLNGQSRKLFMSITPSDWRVNEKIRK